MVCQWIPRVGYCYMSRTLEPHLKEYDGMKPLRPTPIEDFGFKVEVFSETVLFHRVASSTATYEDGKLRDWQDRVHTHQFSLPLVSGPYRRRRKV